MFNRYRKIRSRVDKHAGKFDDAFIKETIRCVSVVYAEASEEIVPSRTLWHALYYPEARRVEIDFYLGEEADPVAPQGVKIRRSGYQAFALEY
jgi:hypothetical protein